MMSHQQKGFGLIEVMITVAIVGILLGIAYPSYRSFIVSSNRAEVQSTLEAMASAMERFRTDNNTYLGAETGGFPSAPATTVFPSQAPIDSSDKVYNLLIQAATGSTYTLRAEPITGAGQDGDGFLEITSSGLKRWDKDNSGTIGTGENTWED